MKKVKLIVSVFVIALTIFSCGSEQSEKNPEEVKHEKALNAFNKKVKEYNQNVEDLCNCLKEKGNIRDCRRFYNGLNFQASQEMADHLKDEEYNLDHVWEGKKRIEECKAEVGL